MQNPSYADEDVADKAVQFLEKVVFKKGLPEFDGLGSLIVLISNSPMVLCGFQRPPCSTARSTKPWKTLPTMNLVFGNAGLKTFDLDALRKN
jgi:hypothetical protein